MGNSGLKQSIKALLLTFFFINLYSADIFAVDGHDLWLLNESGNDINVVYKSGNSQTVKIAAQELINGWKGKKGATVLLEIKKDKQIINDGFRIDARGIHANTETGILYGVYEMLRRQQTGKQYEYLLSNPSYKYRVLNHWDNLDGSIERGYAGKSIFWRGLDDLKVTDEDIKLWREYARANASIGINASVLNNVNASPQMLSVEVLERVKRIANELRPYGVKVYLSINFASPSRLGNLKTSDPLDKEVRLWWKNKVKDIYKEIPDFGGFLVKANSEGQSGPQDYGRTHVDGANMIAEALKPFGGIVMWRAFVYQPNEKDRAKQAYNEFMPFDGQFMDNVIIQIKNGPVDFQPREPFSPLLGALKKTPAMLEFQITQEYLGHSHQLAYLSTMWEECLKSDTYQQGIGSTVASCTDGTTYKHNLTAISGVANIGLDKNWCGHIFAQSNWYAFGRLAWENSLNSEQIADEWLKLTFKPSQSVMYGKFNEEAWSKNFIMPVKEMMMNSRESVVKYMMPLGLHHLFAGNHHYGPGPWYAPKGLRADWTPVYYHKADSAGIGFDRSETGTNAVAQYHEPLNMIFNDIKTCPESLLLWFHHVPWTYKMKSGNNLWDEMCHIYDAGVKEVKDYQQVWAKVKPYVDSERFDSVQNKLKRQVRDAVVWKDGCLLYFQQFSKMDMPSDIELPVYTLDYLMKVDPLNINEDEVVTPMPRRRQ
jgi:alpha-glucuronidase